MMRLARLYVNPELTLLAKQVPWESGTKPKLEAGFRRNSGGGGGIVRSGFDFVNPNTLSCKAHLQNGSPKPPLIPCKPEPYETVWFLLGNELVPD